ncbi:hypothetical protein P7K49_024774 [Saguinus oedipus]|uniref:Uncharacterized protein n=1 Tax=Saguinus oedipus TaxID=9490 RepID=A0ABQ9US35_SAGOE|nr:hypothetical protein P7K49_024774 [Saguinus oedipus]
MLGTGIHRPPAPAVAGGTSTRDPTSVQESRHQCPGPHIRAGIQSTVPGTPHQGRNPVNSARDPHQYRNPVNSTRDHIRAGIQTPAPGTTSVQESRHQCPVPHIRAGIQSTVPGTPHQGRNPVNSARDPHQGRNPVNSARDPHQGRNPDTSTQNPTSVQESSHQHPGPHISAGIQTPAPRTPHQDRNPATSTQNPHQDRNPDTSTRDPT